MYNLNEQLERAVNWVKYAETKNGIALTFLSATLTLLLDKKYLSHSEFIGCITYSVLTINLLLTLWSFYPKTKYRVKKAEDTAKLNPFFFGDVARSNLSNFRSTILNIDKELTDQDKQFLDLTNQIYINCQIALFKFNIFKTVIGSVLSLFVILIGNFLWSVYGC